MKSVVAMILIVFMFGGCAGRPTLVEPTPQQNFTADDGTAVIVGSVSQEFTEGAESAIASFYLDDAEGDRIDSLSVFSIMSLIRKTEFEDVSGHVFAITLEPGTYQFGDWGIDNGTGMYIHPRRPEPLKFAVDRGEVIYIGNLHMNFDTGRNVFGVMITSGGWPKLMDRAKRDIPIIEEKYPALVRGVDKRLLDDHPWSLERLKERYNTTLKDPGGEE